jgi:hypothetical protein
MTGNYIAYESSLFVFIYLFAYLFIYLLDYVLFKDDFSNLEYSIERLWGI